MGSLGRAILLGVILLPLFAFANSWSWLSWEDENLVDQKQRFWEQVEVIEKKSPISPFNFRQHLIAKANSDLMNLDLLIPHYHLLPEEALKILRDRTCLLPPVKTLSSQKILRKLEQFQNILCGRQIITREFLLSEPFVHPSGSSYFEMAKALITKPLLRPGESDSIRTLRETLRKHPLFAAELAEDFSALEAFKNDSLIVETSSFIFIRRSEDSESPEYLVFEKDLWSQSMSPLPVTLVSSQDNFTNGQCIEFVVGGCWAKNQILERQKNQILRWVVITIGCLFVLALAFLLFKQMQTSKLSKRRRDHLVKMLTHELRTPVSSILLIIEELRSQFDQMKPAHQEVTLRLMEQVSRLKRTIELSQKMISSEGREKGMNLTIDRPQMTPAQIIALLEKMQESFSFEILTSSDLAKGSPFKGDLHDLEFCIDNLLRNATIHGRPPIQVKMEALHQQFSIAVIDQGDLSKDYVSSSFLHSNKSQGLGIGLELVREIVHRNGWKFHISSGPTTFKLVMGHKS